MPSPRDKQPWMIGDSTAAVAQVVSVVATLPTAFRDAEIFGSRGDDSV